MSGPQNNLDDLRRKQGGTTTPALSPATPATAQSKVSYNISKHWQWPIASYSDVQVQTIQIVKYA